MRDLEFKRWPKIKRFMDADMIITQKMEGTNAQITFREDSSGCIQWFAGSRNRKLCALHDNFGFYKWAGENLQALYDVLGPGRHYGEWCGPGIQNSEGLRERKFFSFDPFLEVLEGLKHLVEPVPLLYKGPFNLDSIHGILVGLRDHGSKVNGFHPAEGVIVNLSGTRYKLYLDNIDDFAVRHLLRGGLMT